MPCVILTGGPGAGKTTLLAELASIGYATVEESARAIIAERPTSGLSPRPSLSEFAHQILSRDIEKYVVQPQTSKWVFFDRGLIDALGMVQESSPMPSEELEAMLARYPFHRVVFVLPPWEAIYTNDAERDQTYAEAVVVYEKILRWYRSCRYDVHEVPRVHVTERAKHVLRVLAAKTGGTISRPKPRDHIGSTPYTPSKSTK
jgi:predicted ATPase